MVILGDMAELGDSRGGRAQGAGPMDQNPENRTNVAGGTNLSPGM